MKTTSKNARKITCAATLVLALLLAICLLPSTVSNSADAAVKRTAVVTSLLTTRGKVNIADWTVYDDGNETQIVDNGEVFEINKTFPGDRLVAKTPIPAGEGYSMEVDVLKTNSATTKINLSGMPSNIDNGATSNIFISALGIDPGAGTAWSKEYIASGKCNGTNITLNGGYRYRFTYAVSEEDPKLIDVIAERKSLQDENAEWGMRFEAKQLITVDKTQEHLATLYFEGSVTIDNLVVKKADGTVVAETDFVSASDVTIGDWVGAQNFYASDGKAVKDTYLYMNGVSENTRLVTYGKLETSPSLETAVVLNASLKVESTAGKAGIAFGLPEENSAIDAEGVTFVYFENFADKTALNVMKGGEAQTAVDLPLMSQDFHDIKIEGKSDKSMLVYIDGELKATYNEQNFDGYLALVTDGNSGASVSFKPAFTVDTFAADFGDGETLANNFNTGYINPDNYENDTHNSTSLGANGKGIIVENGVLKFSGTSNGTHFAITNGKYADFILQFDWINYAWEDRPTKEDGTVLAKEKPASGRAVELYSPLGIAFGKVTPTGGWAETKLLRLFDGLNVIQFINSDEGGRTDTVSMGRGFTTPEDCEAIQEGKLDLYENTVNFKIVAQNGSLKVFGVIMENGEPQGEHILLAEFGYENCTGYISFSTDEAGYFGIDNLRVTNIDGWTDEQLAAYENFIDIADEAAPVRLSAPVISLNEKKVSWNEVEHATGYIVTVNGKAEEPTTETSYTLAATDAGDYVITVKAITTQEGYTDSAESESVTITVAGGGDSSDKEEKPPVTPEDDKKDKKCGCGSNAVGSVALPVAVLLLAGTVFAVRVRKSKKEN